MKRTEQTIIRHEISIQGIEVTLRNIEVQLGQISQLFTRLQGMLHSLIEVNPRETVSTITSDKLVEKASINNLAKGNKRGN